VVNIQSKPKMNRAQLSVGLIVFLSGSSGFAGYTVNSRVEPVEGGYRYTWTVHNQDQAQGLDVFVIEVPVQTRVLAYSVPPPYSNPEGSGAQWVFGESYEAQVDPHDNQAWVEAPGVGKKLLSWVGQQPPSVYPAGTTATFSLTTDSAVKPGAVRGVATTYTPQNDPHYYAAFDGGILGPSGTTFEPSALPTSIFTEVRFHPLTSPGASNAVPGDEPNAAATIIETRIDLYPGLTIEGDVGRTYGIQYSTDLDGAWRGLANITLNVPRQIWFDPRGASQPRRFYRVFPRPVSIP
jgi:hypothetical protein